MHDISWEVQKFSWEVQNDLRGVHLPTPSLKTVRKRPFSLILALGRHNLLFCSVLVEWWCFGFSKSVLTQGGLISCKQVKVCKRMCWLMVSSMGMIGME